MEFERVPYELLAEFIAQVGESPIQAGSPAT